MQTQNAYKLRGVRLVALSVHSPSSVQTVCLCQNAVPLSVRFKLLRDSIRLRTLSLGSRLRQFGDRLFRVLLHVVNKGRVLLALFLLCT